MRRFIRRKTQCYAFGLLLAGSALMAPIGALAQQDSVSVRAGERYAAGGLRRLVLGTGYRDLWTMPVTVPVLDPDTFAGGLAVLERGGGRQTVSLRFGADDGREYVFRSVDDRYRSVAVGWAKRSVATGSRPL
jgi:hypothetical protein